MSTSTCDPVRKLEFALEQLPKHSSLAVPSVGVDFGTYYVRTAVVCRVDNKITVNLATFPKTDAVAALHYAQAACTNEKNEDLKVYYTGQATDEHHKLLQQTFPKAACIVRRDKMNCHAKGAHLLISTDLPEDLLYHDTTEAKQVLKQLLALFEQFKLFMPPKMTEVITNISAGALAREGTKFPLTMSMIGSNNIVCKLLEDSTFELVDARCDGAYAMEKMWNYTKPPSYLGDFGSFLQLAEKGDRRGVDSLTNEVAEAIGFYSVMPRDYPIFSFGKMEKRSREEVKPEDLARALFGWHTDLISLKSTDFAVLDKAYPVYFTGSLVQHDFVRSELLLRSNISAFNGMTLAKFFRTDATAALGACTDA